MKSHKLIKNPTISGKCVLVLLILIFCLTMTTFVMSGFYSNHSSSDNNSTVLRVLINSNLTEHQNSTKFLLINVERKSVLENYKPTDLVDSSRIARQASNHSKNAPKNYYEEQQPVVVHAESALPIMPPHSENLARKNLRYNDQNQSPFYEDDRSNNGDDYFDSNYYEDGDYKREFGDSEYEAGRSSQNQQFDGNQWQYNPWPFSSKNEGNSVESRTESTINQMESNGRHPAYPSYHDETTDYEYPMGFVRRQPANTPKNQINQEVQKQIQQQSQARIAERQQRPTQQQQQHQQQQQLQEQLMQSQKQIQKQEAQKQQSQMQQANTESTLLSVIKGLKTMWDIYQAFSSAWNTIAEHRQKQEDILREKLRQQQRMRIRVNSRKPPKFGINSTAASMENPASKLVDTDKNNKDKSPTSSAEQSNNKSKTTTARIRSTKPPKQKITTTKMTLTTSSSALAKVEPRHSNTKGDRMRKSEVSALRKRREPSEPTAVAEGRYIKGDPLKGYYDFVITEGSYKFWAIFQTGTAILIIYSVFAAIYYSKVNPLVSDYDYTDYLGGARSLSGGDLDFVDDDGEDQKKLLTSNWYTSILPKLGHSVQFILEAIDKLPAEHEQGNTRGDEEQDYEENKYENESESESLGNYEASEMDYSTTMP